LHVSGPGPKPAVNTGLVLLDRHFKVGHGLPHTLGR